ncbi:endonuclease V [Kribbella karoonensis]|uniref:endonuclease V n=1 Tax=Kribbella karoonensis TaxID=324851 RepID=UPI0031D6119D
MQEELRGRVEVVDRVTLATAVAQVLRLTPTYRLPETTRLADRACREGLRSGG